MQGKIISVISKCAVYQQWRTFIPGVGKSAIIT